LPPKPSDEMVFIEDRQGSALPRKEVRLLDLRLYGIKGAKPPMGIQWYESWVFRRFPMTVRPL